jgi:hypothetical protein
MAWGAVAFYAWGVIKEYGDPVVQMRWGSTAQWGHVAMLRGPSAAARLRAVGVDAGQATGQAAHVDSGERDARMAVVEGRARALAGLGGGPGWG